MARTPTRNKQTLSRRAADRQRKRGNGMRPVRLRLPTARSKITNGVDLLPDVDQRSTWARRYADIRAQLIADRGGVEMVTCAEELLIRRASAIAVECERLESLAAQGVEDLKDNKGTRHRDGRLHRAEVHGRETGRLAMVLKLIGLDRRAIDRTPTLQQLIDQACTPRAEEADATHASDLRAAE